MKTIQDTARFVIGWTLVLLIVVMLIPCWVLGFIGSFFTWLSVKYDDVVFGTFDRFFLN